MGWIPNPPCSAPVSNPVSHGGFQWGFINIGTTTADIVTSQPESYVLDISARTIGTRSPVITVTQTLIVLFLAVLFVIGVALLRQKLGKQQQHGLAT